MTDPTIIAGTHPPDDKQADPVVGRAGVQGQGPFMYIYLAVQGEEVQRAWFETYGCPSAIRCGDWVTKWAVGRGLRQLRVLEAPDLEKVVGGLPLGKGHCAVLAVNALRDAIAKSQCR